LARAPDDRIKIAKEMYETGTALIEIANQFNIPEGTIRSWKNRGKWQRNENCNATDDKKCNVAKKKSVSKKKVEVVATEVEQVIENPDLTDKQRLFCILYVKYRNKTKAYQKAYGASWETANANAYKLWENKGVKKEIERLLSEYRAEIGLDIKDLFQWYLDIARADINDFVEIKSNRIKIKDGSEIDGVLVSEVKEGQFGISVKLYEKSKAMDWLGQHIDLADEEQRARILFMKSKINSDNNEEYINKVNEGRIAIAELINNPRPNRKLPEAGE